MRRKAVLSFVTLVTASEDSICAENVCVNIKIVLHYIPCWGRASNVYVNISSRKGGIYEETAVRSACPRAPGGRLGRANPRPLVRRTRLGRRRPDRHRREKGRRCLQCLTERHFHRSRDRRQFPGL